MNPSKTILGCVKKDRSAQQALFTKFAPYVYTICRRYASSEEDAKEYTQDCFLRVFNKIHLFDLEKGSFKNWLSRLCVNESLNKIKSKSKEIKVVNLGLREMQIPDAEERDDLHDKKQEILIRAIQSLPQGYRNVLNLFIFEKKSHKEISELLGISESTSRSQLTRAKSILKQKILKKNCICYGT